MQKSAGFSLIETMISLTILSMVIMAFMHVTDNQNSATERMDAKVRQMGLVQDLRTQLTTSKGCTDALKVPKYVAQKDGDVKMAFDLTPSDTKDPLMRAGSIVSEGHLRINSVNFKNAQVVDTNATTGERTYLGDVMVQMSAENTSKFNYPEVSAGKVHFIVNKAGGIVDCGASVRSIASVAPVGDIATSACAMPAGKTGTCCPEGTVSTSCSLWSAPGKVAQTICRCEPPSKPVQ